MIDVLQVQHCNTVRARIYSYSIKEITFLSGFLLYFYFDRVITQ